MIDRTHPLSISRQAALLNISRGAVYYLPKPTSERDLAIMAVIDRLRLDFPFKGSCQLCRALVIQGYQVGIAHARTLMRKMGISVLAPQPGTSQRNPQHKAICCANCRSIAATTSGRWVRPTLAWHVALFT
jgi:putative transposase